MDIWATKNGNWSDVTVWNTGALPTAADNVYANGKTVTVNVDVNVLLLTNDANVGLGVIAGGGFSVSTTRTITAANFVHGSTSFFLLSFNGSAINSVVNGNITGGLTPTSVTSNYSVTIAATSGTITINGNLIGRLSTAVVYMNATGSSLIVNGNVSGGTANAAAGLNVNACVLTTVNGNVTDGTNSGSYGVSMNGGSNLTIHGDLSGNSAGAVRIAATSANVYIAGNIVANASIGTFFGALLVQASCTITVHGDITGGLANACGFYATALINATVVGEIKAGSVAYGAVFNNVGSQLIVDTITATNASSANGLSAAIGMTVKVNKLKYAETGTAPIFGQCFLKFTDLTPIQVDVSKDGEVGLFALKEGVIAADLPDPSDVRTATVYGIGGSLSGTMEVPNPAYVLMGVAVDDAEGTLVLPDTALLTTIDGKIDAVGLQVSDSLAALAVINGGVQKSSILVPHTTDL